MASSSWTYTGFCHILLAVGVLPSSVSECSGDSCGNVISMPLMDNMKATLRADVDVTNMNKYLKAYIEEQTQKGVGTAMTDVMRQLMDNKLQEINAKIESTILEQLKRIGVTYIRWGRKDCSDGAELVYTGQAGGNYYNHKGGGVNYLCLPNDPENGERQSYENPQLYGAEYEIFPDRHPRRMSSNLGGKEVPCSVCRRKRTSSVITIPENRKRETIPERISAQSGRMKRSFGFIKILIFLLPRTIYHVCHNVLCTLGLKRRKKTCYKDWNAEYHGYLMADHNVYKGTDYACVDVNSEPFDNKSATNENGALFFPIRTSCGSLRCPPYKANADVLCVVCTK